MNLKKPLKKLKTWGTSDGGGQNLYKPLPEFSAPSVEREREEPELNRITRILGGTGDAHRTAQRVLKLQKEEPAATLPELVTYDWLKSQSMRFVFQASMMGGRSAKGGMLPDFLISKGAWGLAWLIQGDYYHSAGFQSKFTQSDRDIIAKIKLKGQMYQGIRIDQVVDLWESDIYSKRPHIFWLAIAGLEIGWQR